MPVRFFHVTTNQCGLLTKLNLAENIGIALHHTLNRATRKKRAELRREVPA